MKDTESERDKFFADSMKLARDISNNQTFATVKPLLNFFASFTPSVEVSIAASNLYSMNEVLIASLM